MLTPRIAALIDSLGRDVLGTDFRFQPDNNQFSVIIGFEESPVTEWFDITVVLRKQLLEMSAGEIGVLNNIMVVNELNARSMNEFIETLLAAIAREKGVDESAKTFLLRFGCFFRSCDEPYYGPPYRDIYVDGNSE